MNIEHCIGKGNIKNTNLDTYSISQDILLLLLVYQICSFICVLSFLEE